MGTVVGFKGDVTPCEVACSEDFEEMRKLMEVVRALPIFRTEVSVRGKTKSIVVNLDIVKPTLGRSLRIAFVNGVWARIESLNDWSPEYLKCYLKKVNENIFGFDGPGPEALRQLIELNRIIENEQGWMRKG